MFRTILAIIFGFLVGNIAIMAFHYLGMLFYPLPEGIDMNNMEDMKQYVLTAPTGTLFMVMFAHLGGTFVGAIISGLISHKKIVAYIIGALFTAVGGYNIFLLPHPWWFWIEVFLYVPIAIIGVNLMNKKS